MIDTNDLLQDFYSLVNSFQGGFFSPETDFIKAVNNISLELWEMWTRQAERSQEIKDNLFPFLVSKNVMCIPQNSYYTIANPPSDYGRFASAKILVINNDKSVPDVEVENGKCVCGTKKNGKDRYVVFKNDEDLAMDYYNNVREQEIEMVDNQRWSSVLKHLFKKPTFESPKMTQINKGFKVAPRDVSVVILNYYTKPVAATYVYTQVPGNPQTGAGGQIIYNANQSVPLQWPYTVKNEFLWRLGVRFSIFTKDQFMSQITMINKKEG